MSVRIVSVAPRYAVGATEERRAAHWTGHQDALRAAAVDLGHGLEVLGPVDGGPEAAAGAATRRLADGDVDVLVLYEGSLEHLAPFAAVAAAHPSVRVVVNLFKSQRHLDTPRERGDRRADRGTLRRAADGSLAELVRRLAQLVLPENLVLTAETERRALLARGLGLPVVGVWPLHSQLATATPAPVLPAVPDGMPLRVLIQLPLAKASVATVDEVARIVRTVRRLAPGRHAWHLAGRLGGDPRVRSRALRLARLDVEVADRSLDDDAYRALHDAHHVVWLPVRGAYNVQSSGKALDALVRGRPLLAPAGSYGAAEQSRWLPGAPTYGASSEAVEVLLRLPALLDVLAADLARRLDEVRTAYAPTTAVARLLELSLRGPR